MGRSVYVPYSVIWLRLKGTKKKAYMYQVNIYDIKYFVILVLAESDIQHEVFVQQSHL